MDLSKYLDLGLTQNFIVENASDLYLGRFEIIPIIWKEDQVWEQESSCRLESIVGEFSLGEYILKCYNQLSLDVEKYNQAESIDLLKDIVKNHNNEVLASLIKTPENEIKINRRLYHKGVRIKSKLYLKEEAKAVIYHCMAMLLYSKLKRIHFSYVWSHVNNEKQAYPNGWIVLSTGEALEKITYSTSIKAEHYYQLSKEDWYNFEVNHIKTQSPSITTKAALVSLIMTLDSNIVQIKKTYKDDLPRKLYFVQRSIERKLYLESILNPNKQIINEVKVSNPVMAIANVMMSIRTPLATNEGLNKEERRYRGLHLRVVKTATTATQAKTQIKNMNSALDIIPSIEIQQKLIRHIFSYTKSCFKKFPEFEDPITDADNLGDFESIYDNL